MILSRDWREFIESLNFHEVEYILVGGLAVAYHGQPRFTDASISWSAAPLKTPVN
jgi:hypothetical protein